MGYTYKMKKMLNLQPKIYAEENNIINEDVEEEGEEGEEGEVRLHSSSSSLIPIDESYSKDKKIMKQNSKRSHVKSKRIKSKLSPLTSIFKDILIYGLEPQKPISRYPVINFN